MKKKIWVVVLGMVFGVFIFGADIRLLSAAEPYVIGNQTDITGDANTNYAPEAEGFRLYIESLNERGGVKGHPIKVIYEDDKSEPSRAAAVAKKLIESDKVLAITSLGFSRAQPPVYELARKAGVAVITGYTTTEPVWSAKPGDPIFATGHVMNPKFHPGAYGSAKIVEKLYPKGSKVASSAYDTPGGRVWSIWCADWVKKMGYDLVLHKDIPPGTVDFTPWARAIVDTNPVFWGNAIGGEILISLAPTLEKMGWTKDLLVPDFVTEGDLVKSIDRLMTNGEWILWFGRYASAFDNIPEFDNIRKAMNKYGRKFPLSARHGQGWTMARLMEAALTKAGWPCTREGLIAALERTEIDTMGLTGGPIRFTPTDHYGESWWKAYRWDSKKKALSPVMDWIKVSSEGIAVK